MKYLLLWAIFSTICISHASILAVDNSFPSIGQYNTLQAAYDAASPGDTLYIYPSIVNYSNLLINKEIHIVGGGFGYDYPTAGIPGSETGSLTLIAGSANSSILGCKISTLSIHDNNILISNCLTIGESTINGNNVTIKKSSIAGLRYMSGHTGNHLSSCYINGTDYAGYPNYNSGICVENDNNVSISNSVIDPRGSFMHLRAIRICDNCSVVLSNNIIGGMNSYSTEYSLTFGNSSIVAVNNIIINSFNYTSYFTYNISTNSNLPPPNIYVSDIYSLFTDYLNYDYHLAPGSAAIGAGEGGVDCGAYGGISPFDDTYNTPPLSTIIELTTPTTIVDTDEPMQIHIRATTEGN